MWTEEFEAWARRSLSDREIVSVEPAQPVRVEVEAYPGASFVGEILRVGAAADEVSKKFPVEVELPNPDGHLLPGMVVKVLIDLGTSTRRTLLPRDATLNEFGRHFVYVIEADGADLVARRRNVGVRSVPFRPAEFEVLSGLESGEEVAVSDVHELRDGERVRRNGRGGPE